MRNYGLITPEGTKDLLFEECIIRHNIEHELHRIFKQSGYCELITPGLEFYDVFNLKSLSLPQENMYKLTDSKGRLLVMRPDSTIPIARAVATRLKEASLPLRIYYNQTVYRPEPLLRGRSDEIVQTGIELIGSSLKIADFEVISTAVASLKAFGSNFSIEIGNIGIFNTLAASLGASEETAETIRHFVENKDYPALHELLDSLGNSPTIAALKYLPSLFGGEEIFDKALGIMPDGEITGILNDLRDIYNAIIQICGDGANITVDLGLVNKTDYYTGLIIKGYLEGCGEEVLSGGRYDRLISEFGYDVPAVGFAVNVDAVAKVIAKNSCNIAVPVADTIIFAQPGFEALAVIAAQEFRDKGEIVELSLFDDIQLVRDYTKEKRISKLVIIDGESEVGSAI